MNRNLVLGKRIFQANSPRNSRSRREIPAGNVGPNAHEAMAGVLAGDLTERRDMVVFFRFDPNEHRDGMAQIKLAVWRDAFRVVEHQVPVF
jgi:hypothetical protein